MLVINCKNYPEVSGGRIARFVRAAERAARRHGVDVAVAPPQHLIGAVAGAGVRILAQHVDDAAPGGTTGFVVPELLKESGVAGSIINHSEHRVSPASIRGAVARLRGLGMASVLCVRDVAEARRYAGLGPDYVAIEPPELIGSGRAVSRERPGLISRAAAAVGGAGNSTGLLCGAGIVSGEDVSRAVELGASGVLVASGIVKAASWSRAMSEFAGAL